MTDIANEMLINEQIKDKEVRVVGENGDQLGIMSADQALKLAISQDNDLVKIAPNANPPVVKIMDYGKYRFEQTKREKEARKKQQTFSLKEMRLSATIDQHDLAIKAKNVAKFLKDGDKVKISIRFRGRQLSHTEQGKKVMDKFIDILGDDVSIDKQAQLEGRNMFMILSPKLK